MGKASSFGKTRRRKGEVGEEGDAKIIRGGGRLTDRALVRTRSCISIVVQNEWERSGKLRRGVKKRRDCWWGENARVISDTSAYAGEEP